MECNLNFKKQKYIWLIKQPPKQKSNQFGVKGQHMRVFFKQKLNRKVIENAIKSNHIIIKIA